MSHAVSTGTAYSGEVALFVAMMATLIAVSSFFAVRHLIKHDI